MKRYRQIICLLACAVILWGCDNRHSAQRHPLFIKATRCERSGDYRAAIKYYQRFLNVYPESPAAHKAMALLYDDHLLQYLPAIYHYDRYLEYAPPGADTAVIKKWRAAAKRKFYLKTRREYNDPNDVELLRGKNAALGGEVKRYRQKQRRLIAYIIKLKKELAQSRRQADEYQTKLLALRLQLNINTDKFRNLERELKQLKKQLAATEAELKAAQEHSASAQSDATAAAEEADKAALQVKKEDAGMGDTAVAGGKEKAVPVITVSVPPEVLKGRVIDKNDILKDMPPIEAEKQKNETLSSRYYLVQKGDTLSRIARKFYGSAKYYPRLMRANAELLHNDATRLRPGQRLLIPPLLNKSR